MTIFAVTYRYTEDAETRDRVRPEHRDYLRELADQGFVLLSGPCGPSEAPGALLLFRAEDKDQIAQLVAKDPFMANGVIAETTITEWEPVIGPLLPAL